MHGRNSFFQYPVIPFDSIHITQPKKNVLQYIILLSLYGTSLLYRTRFSHTPLCNWWILPTSYVLTLPFHGIWVSRHFQCSSSKACGSPWDWFDLSSGISGEPGTTSNSLDAANSLDCSAKACNSRLEKSCIPGMASLNDDMMSDGWRRPRPPSLTQYVCISPFPLQKTKHDTTRQDTITFVQQENNQRDWSVSKKASKLWILGATLTSHNNLLDFDLATRF